MTRGIHLSRPRAGTVLPYSAIPPRDLSVAGLGDPAVLVMTDFLRVPPFTVTEDRSIDEALRDMIRFGVRALLVVRDGKVSGLTLPSTISRASARRSSCNSPRSRGTRRSKSDTS